jgi:hypothetical protein
MKMYGMLTQDVAWTRVADREREIARMAVERAAGKSSGPRLYTRLIEAARGMRGRKPVGAIRPAASSAAQ